VRSTLLVSVSAVPLSSKLFDRASAGIRDPAASEEVLSNPCGSFSSLSERPEIRIRRRTSVCSAATSVGDDMLMVLAAIAVDLDGDSGDDDDSGDDGDSDGGPWPTIGRVPRNSLAADLSEAA
jgi:hypothetical protein